MSGEAETCQREKAENTGGYGYRSEVDLNDLYARLTTGSFGHCYGHGGVIDDGVRAVFIVARPEDDISEIETRCRWRVASQVSLGALCIALPPVSRTCVSG